MFEPAKTVHALDRVVTVIGINKYVVEVILCLVVEWCSLCAYLLVILNNKPVNTSGTESGARFTWANPTNSAVNVEFN
jgi:hypothetical protein